MPVPDEEHLTPERTEQQSLQPPCGEVIWHEARDVSTDQIMKGLA